MPLYYSKNITPAPPAIKKGDFMTRCKICRCTYDRACANGCSWAGPAQEKALHTSPLCSNCAEILAHLLDYAEVAFDFRTGALMNAVRRILGPRRPRRRRWIEPTVPLSRARARSRSKAAKS
jgi:hypothetical protein